MKCPKCQTDNLDDSKFCKECATPFPGVGGAIPTKTLETPGKSLAQGSTIAEKYKIIELLGRGGMGVVYKAEDIRLKRTVALKFLAPELTREKEAKERFVLEAQTASALNHPNICTVHEIDESEGQMFIAMAFVEGQSLRERVVQGPLKLDEALDVAVQIASGLYEAHEKGIIHRDIKSSNIMITSKGQAVIMDFGIAKLTGDTKITRTGATIGTMAYMSPEQARGEKVDHKTDIWSLGVVLFEMVIGKLPFNGAHEQAVMYSILNENPEPVTSLRTGVPIELERIVLKALQKDPNIRYQHTDEMLVDLNYLKGNLTAFQKSPVIREPVPSKLQPKRWKRLLPWSIAILMTLLAFIFQSKLTQQSSSEGEIVRRFKIEFPAELSFGSGTGTRIVMSPEGTSIVSFLHENNQRRLYIYDMSGFDFLPIPGTEGAQRHFFSPDGNWIGFRAEGNELKKIGLAGGISATITESHSLGASWGEDDTVIFGTNDSGLYSVPSSSGTPKAITELDTEKGETSHRWPEILPGGKAVIFTVFKESFENSEIAAVDLKTGKINPLIQGGVNPHYAHSGHIVFGGVEGTLKAVAFDLEKLETKGQIFQILEDLLVYGGGAANFSLSHNGDLAYLSGSPITTMTLVNNSGIELSSSVGKDYSSPRISPDGKRVAVKVFDGTKSDIYIYAFEDGTFIRLTFDGINGSPSWTPDGQRIVFRSTREGTQDLFWKKADGTSDAEPLLVKELDQTEPSFSSDGKFLVYRETHPDTGRDLWILPMEEGRGPEPFLITPHEEMMSKLSPDDRYVAYVSDETGTREVWVRTFPDPAIGRWQISEGGGREPLWSKDGRKLIYRSEGEIISVDIETDPVFTLGKKTTLFSDVFEKWATSSQNYDIHPEREQFIFLKNLRGSGITVVLNWTEELKRLVPTGTR